MNALPLNSLLGRRLTLSETFYYYDGPKLFSCESLAGQKYLVFWLGDDDLADRWLYVPVSSSRLNLIRSGGFSLREACLKSEDERVALVVIPFGEFENADIKFVSPENIECEDLPHESAFLRLGTTTLHNQIEDAALKAERIHGDILDFALEADGATRNEISVPALGQSLISVQNVIATLSYSRQGFTARRGRPPELMRNHAELIAVEAFAASFGLRLETRTPTDLFHESKVSLAIEDFLILLQTIGDLTALKALLKEKGPRATAAFMLLLQGFASNGVTVKVSWASARLPGNNLRASVKWRDAATAATILAETIGSSEETFTIFGRLDGVDVHQKSFDIVDMATGDRFTGAITDECLATLNTVAARVPSLCKAELSCKFRMNETTGDVRQYYKLLNTKEMNEKISSAEAALRFEQPES
ncbi:MAG: DUF6575 domain-containing protein [Verrucomicrobiota bacterium]